MEMEQRVKTLEYEIKILKNEIQRSLLDIQEQILIHYYPTLRSEDTTPSEATLKVLEDARAKNPPPAAVRKVTLDEVRASQPASAPAAAPQNPAAFNMLSMFEWLMASAAQIGGERTARLVKVCVNRKILAAVDDSIYPQIAALHPGNNHPSASMNDLMTLIKRLNQVLGRGHNIDEALGVLEEAQLG